MNEKTFKIHFIMTGGTIDSHYDGSKDTAVPNKESVILSFIEGLKLYHDAEFTTVCMKDSRELNTKDLENVLNSIEKSPHFHDSYNWFFAFRRTIQFRLCYRTTRTS